MKLIVVTLAVLQATAWLKALAPANMNSMVVTLAVLKRTAWLKATAPENMLLMESTLEVSQPLRFGFPAQFLNRPLMLVTADTVHELMGPY